MKLFKLSLSWTFFLPWLQVPGGDGFLIRNARLQKCIHASSHEIGRVGLADCKPQSAQYHWTWDAATRAIVHWKTGLCLTVPKAQEFAPAQLESCGGDRARQAWVCSRKGHLTLQGLGLHLSTKQEGHKAFLAREKDKFSRWKTETEEIVCAADLAAAPVLSIPVEEFVDPQVWVPEDKTTALSEISTSFIDTRPTSPAIVDEPNITSNLPKNEDVILEADDGTNWKTVILVLSPLAFILGVTILILNIRYNR
ncbi:Ricin B-type lectin domain-containing protein [Podarcis lilfordi]|nr:Ricin B-type lectin domain-containing protein [Podarcis lilfordi]